MKIAVIPTPGADSQRPMDEVDKKLHEKKDEALNEYLSNVTIHGLHRIGEARTIPSRFMWMSTVLLGLALCGFVSYQTYLGWGQNPIATSVAQLPIESIIFPPVTVCPILPEGVNCGSHLAEDCSKCPLGQGAGFCNGVCTWGNDECILGSEDQIGEDVEMNHVVKNCQYLENNIDTGMVCDRIQAVASDLGTCFTFNNNDLSDVITEGPVQVTGVGKPNGLRLQVNPAPFGQNIKYRVFVTTPGTTYSKVFFDIDPKYNGEHHFHSHGLHYVRAGAGFPEWNADKMVCYFPKDRKLAHFYTYQQDNCRLECGWNHTIGLCGCAPSHYKLHGVDTCTAEGKKCWTKHIKAVSRDVLTSCDCRFDCEMTHFFYSMRREFNEEGHNLTTSPLYFFFDTHIITQINIEMRLTFFDKVSSLGGTLGLFCGISIISVIEILFYSISIIKNKLFQC